MNSTDYPPYIYRMRELDYPPGYRLLTEETSLKMYDNCGGGGRGGRGGGEGNERGGGGGVGERAEIE